MSKSKPKASEPSPLGKRVSSGTPPTTRKTSQPNLSAPSTPKFYDGPTTPRSTSIQNVNQKVSAAANKTAAVAKTLPKKTVTTAKRYPRGFFSLIGTIPFLIILSLASTVLCPPPGPPSGLNRYVLSPLGYPEHQSHPILCYPANVYHREVLQPYIYPILGNLHTKITTSAPYIDYVEPTSRQAKQIGVKAWNGPIKPVVNRIRRGVRRFYLTFIQPHVPYFRAKYHTFADPYTARISAFASPYVAKANVYANQTRDYMIKFYRCAASHPFTGHAGRYARKGYTISSEKGNQAYQWSKPHALRASVEAKRIATQVLGPRAVRALEIGAQYVSKTWKLFKVHACAQYRVYLEPHVGPYVKKASAFLAPYYALYHKHIHTSYVQPVYQAVFPQAPEKPKSLLGMLADWLPVTGLTAAESRGGMDDYFGDAEKSKREEAREKTKVVKSEAKAEPKVKAKSEPEEVKEEAREKPFDRKELDRSVKDLKAKVNEEGKKGEAQVKKEIQDLQRDVLNHKLPQFATNVRSEIDREIEYVLKGLDKLYTQSTSLTKDQVKMSSDTSDNRVRKTVEKIQKRLDLLKGRVYDERKPIVKNQSDKLDAILGNDYQALAAKMSSSDKTTVKDWDKYHEVRKVADGWKEKYAKIPEDPALAKPFAELRVELDDIHEAFRTRIGVLKRTAFDRIEAREAVKASKKEEEEKKEKKHESGKVSILPVAGEAGAAAAGVAGAAGIIGKGKEQVMSALSAASGETTTAGIVEQAKSSVDSILSVASSNVHDATRTVIKAAGGNPTPDSPREHAESVYSAASVAANSVISAARSNLHEVTKSVSKVVGATPSPESPKEHIQSVYSAAQEGLQSLAGAASAVVHDAAGSVSLALGAAPTPESLGESVESVIAAASSAAHDASRIAVSAVGGTPSPESPAEHIESAYHAATDSAASIASVISESAASVATYASSSVHSATRSALSAAGATPSPESAQEYLESIAGVVKQGAASVYDVAGSNIHDATRSMVKAAGGTPTPETPGEYAESVYNAANEGIIDAAEAVAEQASRLAAQIQEALGAVSTQEPLASSASSYLSSLVSVGSSTAAEALATGSSILLSLQGEASSSIHSATRSASSLLGATPTPETAGEYVEDAKARAASARQAAESLVRKHAEQIKRDLEKDGKKVEDYSHGHGHKKGKGTKDEL
ncbi:hypothetical protein J010_04703 [Cryptococcus neoformans]|nr:hypothetical protein C355_04828 [Cryptococcus neoformans var. grubii Th84]OXG54535.1 hypothetical protein C354_04734 [Cryptococcus neoformans var. grubii MW-RSA1955]OXG57899.1 hypothetical protein C352_04717 [Cryptococcus neoformans var. grubii CHC193]OXG61152.1 hypothetical protein C351_04685 [Cryptococcus neoformans var. grubii c8]OXG81809.1 hypothetical protein C346_04741 [Cryptococcus neoformans var. grubii D17-1]OXG94373.1 hypothetical protein C345_04628 [Cryptococcus neoformans var. g